MVVFNQSDRDIQSYFYNKNWQQRKKKSHT